MRPAGEFLAVWFSVKSPFPAGGFVLVASLPIPKKHAGG